MAWAREQQADGRTVWRDAHGSRWRVPDLLREAICGGEMWEFWGVVKEVAALIEERRDECVRTFTWVNCTHEWELEPDRRLQECRHCHLVTVPDWTQTGRD